MAISRFRYVRTLLKHLMQGIRLVVVSCSQGKQQYLQRTYVAIGQIRFPTNAWNLYFSGQLRIFMMCPDAVQGTISCTLSYTSTGGTGSIINLVPFLVTGMVQDWWYDIHISYTQDGWPFTNTHHVERVLFWMDFLHAGQIAMHTATFLHISHTGKTDHTHGPHGY